MRKNGIIINSETITYYKDGKIHREDGPAIEWRNGNRHWCLNGCLHRTDGPAIELVETEQRCTINKWSINGFSIVKMVRLLNGVMAIKNGGITVRN